MPYSVTLFSVGMLSLGAALCLQLAGRTTDQRARSGNMAAIGTTCLVFAVLVGVI